MQEEQTASFQPVGYEGHVPWFVNLFLVYLLYALLMTVVRAVLLIWALRKHRKAQEDESPLESGSQRFCEDCQSKIQWYVVRARTCAHPWQDVAGS